MSFTIKERLQEIRNGKNKASNGVVKSRESKSEEAIALNKNIADRKKIRQQELSTIKMIIKVTRIVPPFKKNKGQQKYLSISIYRYCFTFGMFQFTIVFLI